MQPDDLELVLERRVVEPQVQAAALERLGQLARVVGGQQHDRVRAGLDAAELGDRELEVREQLEQHRLELLVGLVDLVDQQHDGLSDAIAAISGRASRNSSPKMSSWTSCQPVPSASAWMRSSCLR